MIPDDLRARIRAEAEQPTPFDATSLGVRRFQRCWAFLDGGSGYRTAALTDLLTPRAEFIDFAYLVLLGRPADEGGKDHYHRALCRGDASPIDVLGALRYSAEGRRVGTRVPGLYLLWLAAKIRQRFRHFGAVLQLPVLLAALPWYRHRCRNQGEAIVEALR